MEPRYCAYSQCGKEIPPHLIRRHSDRKYCDRDCARRAVTEKRKQQGFYQRFSQFGLAKLRAMQTENGGVRPGHVNRSQAMREHNKAVPRRHVSGWHKRAKKSMDIAQIIEQIIATAKLKPIEERVMVLRFGLRGEEPRSIKERLEIFQADETVTVKHVNKDWLRGKEAKAIQRMRGAFSALHIDHVAFRAECEKSEKYKDFCDVLLGYVF